MLRKESSQKEAVPLNYLKNIPKLCLKRQFIFIGHMGYYFIRSQRLMVMTVKTVSSGKHTVSKNTARKPKNKHQI